MTTITTTSFTRLADALDADLIDAETVRPLMEHADDAVTFVHRTTVEDAAAELDQYAAEFDLIIDDVRERTGRVDPSVAAKVRADRLADRARWLQLEVWATDLLDDDALTGRLRDRHPAVFAEMNP